MRAILLGGMIAIAASAGAQDAATMAAQQAMQAAQQANQQAMEAAQQANQQAMEAAQQANQQAMQDMQNAANQAPAIAVTRAPRFSAESGRIAAGTLIRITCPTHYAAIYYTTNGWSPTIASRRYTGPILIRHDTVLRAMAIAPNMTRSLITRAEYKVPGSSSVKPAALDTNGVLRAGTKLQLATTAELDSSKAQIGDTLPLRLDQDITVGGKIVIPKGTPVEAAVTLADPPGHAGLPGDIVFEVHTLAAKGITIPLAGGETLEGPVHVKRTIGLMMIPLIGPVILLAHGDPALIKPDMTFRVTVRADTSLQPTTAAGSETP